MTNENIAPSEIMLKTKEGMPSGAFARLVAWFSLEYYLEGALGIPNLWVLSVLILLILISHPKLEDFNHKKHNGTSSDRLV